MSKTRGLTISSTIDSFTKRSANMAAFVAVIVEEPEDGSYAIKGDGAPEAP